FHKLSELTHPRGEVVLTMSSMGDLVDLQRKWSKKLTSGTTDNSSIKAVGDVIYDTELGQPNFCHVFGTDLNDHMSAITRRRSPRQYWWVEGIRLPDDEFTSQEAERDNYSRVRKANDAKRGCVWAMDDYREFHTVAAFRSPMNPWQR